MEACKQKFLGDQPQEKHATSFSIIYWVQLLLCNLQLQAKKLQIISTISLTLKVIFI